MSGCYSTDVLQGEMRLRKPAVITVRVTYPMQNYLEALAVRAGLSLSDLLRMALVVGAKHQAWAMGIFDVELHPTDEAHNTHRPRTPGKSEGRWMEREQPYVSDGTFSDETDRKFQERLRKFGVKEVGD